MKTLWRNGDSSRGNSSRINKIRIDGDISTDLIETVPLPSDEFFLFNTDRNSERKF